MASLLDGIKNLRTQRSTLSPTNDCVEDQNGIDRMIAMYADINKRSEYIHQDNSPATEQDKQTLEKIEKAFTFCWNNLAQDKQKELVDQLLKRGLLPERVKEVLEMFNGEVVSLL